MVVILELREREKFIPVILALRSEYAYKLFQFLVHVLCLPICLRMICRRGCHADPQEVIKFAHEVRHELWAAIRHHILRESVEFPDVVEIESCGPTGRDRGVGRYKVGSLSQGIHCDHNGVVTVRFGQFSNKVHGYCLPGTRGYREWLELSHRYASVFFSPQA